MSTSSIAYEFGSSSKGPNMSEVKQLAEVKKKKRELLAQLLTLDKQGNGEVPIEEFNRISTEVGILLDEKDYDFLLAKYCK
jgi:Ca2+-binding EF-hand superfamily protein